MNYKKYLLFILLIMIFGINKTYAQECFYQSGDISLEYNSNNNKFLIRQRKGLKDEEILANGEKLVNKNDTFTDGNQWTGIRVEKITTECPNYVVYRRKERTAWWSSDGIWGFDNYQDAENFRKASLQIKKMSAWTAGHKNSDGTEITRNQFEETIETNVTTIKENIIKYGIGDSGTDVDINCSEIFGNKNDEDSIAYLVNEILKYPRYIVPALLIVFGSLDFFKAVIASKEDEMKKAQATFIKRLIVGVAVYLVPVIINVLMWLADIAWEGLGYTHCGI